MNICPHIAAKIGMTFFAFNEQGECEWMGNKWIVRPCSRYHLVTGTHSRAWDDTCQGSQVISFMHDLCPLHAEKPEQSQAREKSSQAHNLFVTCFIRSSPLIGNRPRHCHDEITSQVPYIPYTVSQYQTQKTLSVVTSNKLNTISTKKLKIQRSCIT